MKMEYGFDVIANKSGYGNMKTMYTPAALKKNGYISYAGAEMDFKTAPVICEAIKAWAEQGMFTYTLMDERYIAAVSYWMKKARAWDVEEEWLVPTHGTIFGLSTAIRAFTKKSDGVITLTPGYYRHEQAVRRNGRTVVQCELLENGGLYTIDFQQLEQQMKEEQNTLLVLCNPHNPIGRVWTEEELIKISKLANQYGVRIFSDEIFAEVTSDAYKVIPYCEIEGADQHSMVCTSLGKGFNFTGVNHANVFIKNPILREEYIKQKYVDHFGSIEPFAYAAVTAAYSEEGYAWIQSMNGYVEANKRMVHSFFATHFPEIVISPAEGTFVLWIDVRSFGLEEKQLLEFFEKEVYLHVDPGTEYGPGGEGFIRLNIATPRKELQDTLDRLLHAVKIKNENIGGQVYEN